MDVEKVGKASKQVAVAGLGLMAAGPLLIVIAACLFVIFAIMGSCFTSF